MNRIVRILWWWDDMAGIMAVTNPILNPGGYRGTFHLHVYFEDERCLSIIQGPFSVGAERGNFEIGYMLEGNLVDHPLWKDQVQGHLEESEVLEEIQYVHGVIDSIPRYE